ncbi:hypothetical protein [Streptococcus oralis]|uniref:hypothetical protein n=1 Tax=Streptococcus oralis TaxID=1303 RepID=UPI000A737637|nr:hypothetical protein [Streptococcus oralis]
MSLNHRYYAKGETNPDVIHYMSGFFLAGMTQIITTWLRRNCLESVEMIASILRRCIPSSKA